MYMLDMTLEAALLVECGPTQATLVGPVPRVCQVVALQVVGRLEGLVTARRPRTPVRLPLGHVGGVCE